MGKRLASHTIPQTGRHVRVESMQGGRSMTSCSIFTDMMNANHRHLIPVHSYLYHH